MRKTLGTISIVTALVLTGCGDDSSTPTPVFVQVKDLSTTQKTAKIKATLTAYADYAIEVYDESLKDAEAMKAALTSFTSAPREATLIAAKEAWLKSRESYGRTEALRLSCGPIDGSGECAEGTATVDGFTGETIAADNNKLTLTLEPRSRIWIKAK